MAELVYFLCFATSLTCALLLVRGYIRSRARLLLWSGASFAGLAINNLLLVVDLVFFPEKDLFLLRLVAALVAMLVLVGGLISEEK